MDGLVKACMQSLSSLGIVLQDDRSAADCGSVAREMGDVGGLSVYITQNSGRSACLPMVIVTFWYPGMASNDVTTRFAAVSARSLPLILVCPLIFLVLWEGLA